MGQERVQFWPKWIFLPYSRDLKLLIDFGAKVMVSPALLGKPIVAPPKHSKHVFTKWKRLCEVINRCWMCGTHNGKQFITEPPVAP